MKDSFVKAIVLLVLGVLMGESLPIESLIPKANIYYQINSPNDALQEETLGNLNELNSKNNFKVIVHGFLGSRTHSSIKPLGNAYMANGAENVLLADWEDAAGLDYHSSRKVVSKVSVFFAKMLHEFFNKHDIDRSEVHVLGHSLGAHIAGGIGEWFNGTLGRVTGLDPALPLFMPNSIDGLQATAAQFVDVIHTDYPVFGDFTMRGIVDFYPNFGLTPQRGCEDVDLLSANSCSHNRAVLLYAESIGSPQNFPTIHCNLSDIKLRNVSSCTNTKEHQIVYMGESVSRSASGSYYLETYDAPPYGLGLHSKFLR